MVFFEEFFLLGMLDGLRFKFLFDFLCSMFFYYVFS